MTFEKALFRDLRATNVTKVRIGNGGYISIEGKGVLQSQVVLTQLIFYVLFVLRIDQNLLGIGQLTERGF